MIEKLIPKKIDPMKHQLHLHLNGVHLPAMVRSVSLGDEPTSVISLVSKEMASSWSSNITCNISGHQARAAEERAQLCSPISPALRPGFLLMMIVTTTTTMMMMMISSDWINYYCKNVNNDPLPSPATNWFAVRPFLLSIEATLVPVSGRFPPFSSALL